MILLKAAKKLKELKELKAPPNFDPLVDNIDNFIR